MRFTVSGVHKNVQLFLLLL